MQDKFDIYRKQYGVEPLYALVGVQYKDDDNSFETTIKLLDCADENNGEDERIFYYCSGLEDLKSLTEAEGMEDFIITHFIGFTHTV